MLKIKVDNAYIPGRDTTIYKDMHLGEMNTIKIFSPIGQKENKYTPHQGRGEMERRKKKLK